MTIQQSYNLRLCGIGGQGVVSLSSVIARAAARQGLTVSVIDRPRSAMRLGPITCDLRFGAAGRAAFIPAGNADAVLALEPLDGALNAARLLKRDGLVVLNAAETLSIDELVAGERDARRDEWIALVESRGAKVVRADAPALAKKAGGSAVDANFFLLGLFCRLEKRFPVSVESFRAELSGDAKMAFEAGLLCVC